MDLVRNYKEVVGSFHNTVKTGSCLCSAPGDMDWFPVQELEGHMT